MKKTSLFLLGFLFAFSQLVFVTPTVYAALKIGSALETQAKADCLKKFGQPVPDDKVKICSDPYKEYYASGTSATYNKWMTGENNKCAASELEGFCRIGITAAGEARKRDLAPGSGGASSAPSATNTEIEAIAKTDPACENGITKLKEACIDGFIAGYQNKKKSDVCKQRDSKEKTSCEKGFDAGVEAQNRGVTKPSAPDADASDKKVEEDACNATGSPMSWIICPIIDMGSKFTDFVFNDIVRPFLEDVPISSKPDDPSYNAWKQFRLIGNIVLIGSLMAVVYAQARGDK